MKKIDIVVPCYNEAECISLIYSTVDKIFREKLSEYEWDVIYIDDGSNLILLICP